MLRPLVYAEPLRLVAEHHSCGERVYIVSATLQEIVDAIAEDLGFDGALGTICEVRDGRYTGRAVRALHAEAKAECLREVAAEGGLDLAGCTTYSDSHTDLPFLEPSATRGREPGSCPAPDRCRRAWPVSSSGCAMQPEEALSRLRALGFAEADVQELWEHFDGAERRGKQGHGHARIPWLEGLEGYDPAAAPQVLEREEGFERWHGGGAIGYLVLGRVVRAPARAPAGSCSARRLRAHLPDRDARHHVRRLPRPGSSAC